MHFNYRFIATKDEDGNNLLQLHEVYYEEDGSIAGWSSEPIQICGETLEEVKQMLEWVVAATTKSILTNKNNNLKEQTQ